MSGFWGLTSGGAVVVSVNRYRELIFERDNFKGGLGASKSPRKQEK